MKTTKLEKSVKLIGISQMVIGFLTISFGVVIITLLNQKYFINNNAVPIWCGVILICTGVLGVCSAAFSDKKCLIKSYIGANVFSVLLMLLEFCASLAGIVYYEACPAEMKRQMYSPYNPEPTYPPCYRAVVGRGMFSITLSLAVVGSAVTATGLVKCWKLLKSRKNKKGESEINVGDDEMTDLHYELADGNQIVTMNDGKKYKLIPYSMEDEHTISEMKLRSSPHCYADINTEQ